MNSLRFIHISDTHIAASPEWESYGHYALDNSEAVVEYLNTKLPFEPEFILHTGDVTFNPKAEAYPVAQKVLSKLRYPVYYVRGNHDQPDFMRQHLDNVPDGGGNLDYDFWIDDFHFIVLDTFGFTKTIGILEDEQLEWLASTLDASPARSIVLAVHHLPVTTGVECSDERMIIKNHDAFFETIVPHRGRIRGVFFGHIHRQTQAIRQGIFCSSAPAVWFQLYNFPESGPDFVGDPYSDPGFNIVTVTHDDCVVASYTVPKPPHAE